MILGSGLAGLRVLALLAAPVEIQEPHDAPPTLALAWSAADLCPSRADVIARIRAQGVDATLGEWVPDHHDQAALAVEIAIEAGPELWRAELVLVDADGRVQRSFAARDCEALADAVALIVAVTLDPVAVSRIHEASVEPSPNPSPVPTREPEPEPPLLGELAEPFGPREIDEPDELGINLDSRDDESVWPANLRVGVSIAGGAGYGPTRTGYAQTGGRLALFGRLWRAELGGRWAIPRRITQAGVVGSFDAWQIEARACWVPSAGPVELPLCPGVEVGRVRGRGLAPTPNPTRSEFWWVAPTLSQGLSWAPVERFAIGPELALVVPLTRASFVVGSSEVDRFALLGVRASLVLELRLP